MGLSLTSPTLLASFERSLRAVGRSPRTVGNYMSAASAFGKWLEGAARPTDVELVKRSDVEAWLVELVERGNSPSTVASRYRCLQQLWRWLLEEDEVSVSPMAKMRPPHVPEPVTEVLSEDDQRRLLAACAGREFEDRRDLAIISLFLDGGLRLAELANLTLANINLESGAATVLGKGSRVRVARFGAVAARNLDRYFRVRERHPAAATEWLWLGSLHGGRNSGNRLQSAGIARMVERRASKAGLEGVHPHVFRHTFAHRFRSIGGSEGDLMILGGWRSRSMIDRYGKSAAADRAAEAHARHSPLDNLSA